MNILICGCTGMLGQALIKHWYGIHNLVGISRNKHKYNGAIPNYSWNQIDLALTKHDIDVVINLSGESIGQYWHEKSKLRILSSRIETTKLIVSHINENTHLINASGIGIYGHTKDFDSTIFDEQTKILESDEFLQSLALKWEKATKNHKLTTLIRTSPVFSKDQGILKKLLLGNQIRLLTQFGTGKQPFPWVGLADWCNAIDWIITNKYLGPINITNPKTTSYKSLMDDLCNITASYKITIPNKLVEFAMGEMGRTLFLRGTSVKPSILVKHGFKFKEPTIASILKGQHNV